MVAGVAIAVCLVVAGLLIAVSVSRKREQANARPEVISLLFAEHVARTNRRRSLLFVWLLVTHLLAAIVGLIPRQGIGGALVWAGLGYARFANANMMLKLIALPGATATLHGRFVTVQAGLQRAQTWATRRVIESARKRSVPESIARSAQ